MSEEIKETINNLKALALDGDSHENLSAICSVLYMPNYGWTRGDCKRLRDVLVGMLEQLDPDEWSDEYLAEVGLVRLPKDADGKYIHIGDVMQWPNGETFEVEGIGSAVVFYIDENGAAQWTAAYDKTHHKPTVRDVMREFLERWRSTYRDDVPALYDEYEPKLREAMRDDQ